MLIHQRKAEVVIFMSDKADIRAKKMIRHKKRALDNDERVSSPRRH